MVQYVERRHTDSEKWDTLEAVFGKADLLPLWVADMDFKVPDCVEEAIQNYLKTGVIGYYEAPASYYQAFIDWERERHGLTVKREWIRFSPGVVAGFNWAICITTDPGDAVLVTTPVYYPFLRAVENNGRRLVTSELVNRDGRYTIDFEDFERKITENHVKTFLFCSPHNPVSRVWTEEELLAILSICRKHGVSIISDEIHQDLVFSEHPHIPTLALAEEGDRIILLTAASKTFNIAGLQNAFAVIPDPELRKRWEAHATAVRIVWGNPIGYVSVEAAYTKGKEWLSELLSILRGNYEYVRDTLTKALPKVVVTPLEGTYLAWIDFGAYLNEEDVQPFMQDRCGLAFDYGTWFGGTKSGTFIRFNLATSRENVETAVQRIIGEIEKMA